MGLTFATVTGVAIVSMAGGSKRQENVLAASQKVGYFL